MKKVHQIKVGAVLSYVSIFLNILAGFLCTPLIINLLGQSRYGIYTLCFSVINTFLIDFGLGTATSRYVAKFKTEGNQKAIDDIFGLIIKLFIALSLLFGIVLGIWIVFADKIYVGLSADEIHAFKIAFAITAAYSVLSFPFATLDGVLTSYEKFIQGKLVTIVTRVLLTIGIVLCVIFKLNLYSLIICHAVCGIAGIGLKIFFVYKYTPARPNLRFRSKSAIKEIAFFSLWTTIATLANRLIFNICPSLLGIFATSTDIAIFGLVATIESYVYVFSTAINGMFLPRITDYYHGDDPTKKLEPLMIKIGKFQMFVNGLIICGFIVLGQPFLNWWVGPDYSLAYYGIIAVIVPGLFFNSLQIANTTMIVVNKIKYRAIVEIIAGITNLALCIPLSIKFGFLGACISICIAYVLRVIVTNLICVFALKLPMKRYYLEVYFKMCIPLVIVTLLGLVSNTSTGYMDAYNFVKTGFVVVALYFALSIVFGVSKRGIKNV